jgi:CheY-like chemotaxis protein
VRSPRRSGVQSPRVLCVLFLADQRARRWFVLVSVRFAGGMDENATVFVVENNADHIYQLEQALRKAALSIELKIARYGNEAVLYLKGVGIYSDRTTYPIPRVILLDLDLPDGSALAVLGWIRQQQDLFGVPVLALAYPGQQHLTDEARRLGATAHFAKGDFGPLLQTVQSLLRPDMLGKVAA